MDINVLLQDGLWVTEPNPTVVFVGTKIRWVFKVRQIERPTLAWTIKFRYSPFIPGRRGFGSRENSEEISVKSRFTGLGSDHAAADRFLSVAGFLTDAGSGSNDFLFDHYAVTPAHTAQEEGQYKYDLSVKDAETEEPLSDEDPILVVIPVIYGIPRYP